MRSRARGESGCPRSRSRLPAASKVEVNQPKHTMDNEESFEIAGDGDDDGELVEVDPGPSVFDEDDE